MSHPDLPPNRVRLTKSTFIVVLSAGVTSWSAAVGFMVNQDKKNDTKA